MVGAHSATRVGMLAGALRLPSHRAEARLIRDRARECLARTGLADWADRPEKSCVAYVVRDNAFGAIIRAVSALFLHTRHCTFYDRDEAVDWLTH
jgi:hypothetical protein